jgi:hypothetical protein
MADDKPISNKAEEERRDAVLRRMLATPKPEKPVPKAGAPPPAFFAA